MKWPWEGQVPAWGGLISEEISRLEDRVRVLEQKVKVMKCSHTNLEFRRYHIPYRIYKKVCTDCEEVLEMYTNESKFLREKAQHIRSEVEEMEKRASKLEEEECKES